MRVGIHGKDHADDAREADRRSGLGEHHELERTSSAQRPATDNAVSARDHTAPVFSPAPSGEPRSARGSVDIGAMTPDQLREALRAIRARKAATMKRYRDKHK